MATDRKIINYLPLYVQDFSEIVQIMKADQNAIDMAWNNVEDLMNSQFVSYAPESGVKRWESMLGITPKTTDTLQERRFRILTWLQTDVPYTVLKLKRKLSTLCGEDGYFMTIVPDEYSIAIKLAVGNISNQTEVQSILDEMIPANMISTITILYNTYAVLSSLTHATLSSYTNNQLREEVFS